MAVINRTNASRTVALLSTKTSKGIDVATGVFVLRKDGAPFLLTAAHFGKAVNGSTLLEMPNGVGRAPSVFPLLDLSKGQRIDSAIGDLSAFPLVGIKPTDKKLFTSRFLTNDAILGDTSKPVDREKLLTVMGFPSGLGHDSSGALVPYPSVPMLPATISFSTTPLIRNRFCSLRSKTPRSEVIPGHLCSIWIPKTMESSASSKAI